ncbi:GAF domain-containing protein [Xanthobacter sp. KR7-225]|uniref:helix-turn-helix domain-containing protein n=1 Tax=Xanthobacter sp. KR7-225 TaxID=3156613 RepID=UPI0032B3544B
MAVHLTKAPASGPATPDPMASYRRILRLLSDNAPLASFDRLAEEIRRGTRDDDLVREVLADIAVAARLRENSEQKRKREGELTALYETARDLAALRDTDQVLRAIVQRAKQLAGSDIAYLSAADDEHGDFYVRATEGVVSRDFATIRVPRNIGVCGSVAKSRSPFQSSNYPADTKFDHDRGIDRATAGEGIVSILGVPLALETQVIGVLFVGDRYVRSYTPHEIAVLSSLATFAALAIENARLLEEAQRALRMARQANAALQAKAEDVEEAAIAHEQLTELIARGGSLEDLTRRVSNLLKGEACILDDRRRLTCGQLPSQVADEDIAKAIRDSAVLGRSVPLRGIDGSVTMVVAVMGGSARLGALLLTRAKALSESEIRTLERSALVSGIVLMSLERVAQAAYRNVSDIVSALLRGATDPFSPECARQLPSGVSLSWPITLLLVDASDVPATRISSAVRSSLSARDTILAEFNGDVVIVTNAGNPAALAGRVAEVLDEAFQTRFSIVITAPIAALDRVPAEYQALRRACGLMGTLGQKGRIVFEKTLSIYALLFDKKSDDATEQFVMSAVGPIIEHDRRRRSQLAATLLAYMDNGHSLQKAAAALGIHVNTMRQRLESITQIAPTWSEASRTLDIHLALRLHAIGQAS